MASARKRLRDVLQMCTHTQNHCYQGRHPFFLFSVEQFGQCCPSQHFQNSTRLLCDDSSETGLSLSVLLICSQRDDLRHSTCFLSLRSVWLKWNRGAGVVGNRPVSPQKYSPLTLIHVHQQSWMSIFNFWSQQYNRKMVDRFEFYWEFTTLKRYNMI